MTTAFEQIDPTDKKLPYQTAIEVLDLADRKDWGYAPMLDGCYERHEMEVYLKNNTDAAIAIVISYDPECADSIDVSMINGKLTLELEDNFYYAHEHVESVSDISDAVMKMLKAYHSQSDDSNNNKASESESAEANSEEKSQPTNLLRVTEKKKDLAIASGHELVGFVVKKGDSFQIIADGRARNISDDEYSTLMQYPE